MALNYLVKYLSPLYKGTVQTAPVLYLKLMLCGVKPQVAVDRRDIFLLKIYLALLTAPDFDRKIQPLRNPILEACTQAISNFQD